MDHPQSRTHAERWEAAATTFRIFVPEAEPEKVAAVFARRLGPLGTFAFETVGEMWSRPQLSRRDRSLLVVTTLATQARDEELVGHTQIALRHGLTQVEIEEILPMVAAYAGFPAAMAAARHIDEGLRIGLGVDKLPPRTGAAPKDDHERDAEAALSSIVVNQGPASAEEVLVDLIDRLGHVGEVAFRWNLGEVWARPELSPRDRSIVVLSILTTQGAEVALADHVAAGLDNGLEPDEILEVISHLSLYAGISRATTAMLVARDVLAIQP
ncbi:MAG: carboxymuconolactone decarboxylase family protein [Acidimicrobiales bacterium]